jgi:NO-binding membrane sensor protein with MHYT domain
MQMQGSEGGLYIVALAFVMSCVGCGLGLSAMVRARSARRAARERWLALGAVAIGGTGIWVMHFIAMLGYSLPNTQIRYNVLITLASLLVAVGVVWFGLRFTLRGGSIGSVIPGGVITGIGVAGMHYLGMSAMDVAASVHYRLWVVALSVLIAVTAATVALWFAANLDSAAAILGAAMVMGVAVCGMHYTGMAAMVVTGSSSTTVTGLTSTQLLGPLAAVVSVSTFVILLTIGFSPSAQEIEREAGIKENLRKLAAMRDRS